MLTDPAAPNQEYWKPRWILGSYQFDYFQPSEELIHRVSPVSATGHSIAPIADDRFHWFCKPWQHVSA
jgi:hypothetical protein